MCAEGQIITEHRYLVIAQINIFQAIGDIWIRWERFSRYRTNLVVAQIYLMELKGTKCIVKKH